MQAPLEEMPEPETMTEDEIIAEVPSPAGLFCSLLRLQRSADEQLALARDLSSFE